MGGCTEVELKHEVLLDRGRARVQGEVATGGQGPFGAMR